MRPRAIVPPSLKNKFEPSFTTTRLASVTRSRIRNDFSLDLPPDWIKTGTSLCPLSAGWDMDCAVIYSQFRLPERLAGNSGQGHSMPDVVSTETTKIYENMNLTVKARIEARNVESIQEVTFKFLKDGEQF